MFLPQTLVSPSQAPVAGVCCAQSLRTPVAHSPDVYQAHQISNTFSVGNDSGIRQFGTDVGRAMRPIAGLVCLDNALARTHGGPWHGCSKGIHASRSGRW